MLPVQTEKAAAAAVSAQTAAAAAEKATKTAAAGTVATTATTKTMAEKMVPEATVESLSVQTEKAAAAAAVSAQRAAAAAEKATKTAAAGTVATTATVKTTAAKPAVPSTSEVETHKLYAAFFFEEKTNRPILELGIELKRKKQTGFIKIQWLYQADENSTLWQLTNEWDKIREAQTHFVTQIILQDKRTKGKRRKLSVENPVSTEQWNHLQEMLVEWAEKERESESE
jgi:hypothetical protein